MAKNRPDNMGNIKMTDKERALGLCRLLTERGVSNVEMLSRMRVIHQMLQTEDNSFSRKDEIRHLLEVISGILVVRDTIVTRISFDPEKHTELRDAIEQLKEFGESTNPRIHVIQEKTPALKNPIGGFMLADYPAKTPLDKIEEEVRSWNSINHQEWEELKKRMLTYRDPETQEFKGPIKSQVNRILTQAESLFPVQEKKEFKLAGRSYDFSILKSDKAIEQLDELENLIRNYTISEELYLALRDNILKGVRNVFPMSRLITERVDKISVSLEARFKRKNTFDVPAGRRLIRNIGNVSYVFDKENPEQIADVLEEIQSYAQLKTSFTSNECSQTLEIQRYFKSLFPANKGVISKVDEIACIAKEKEKSALPKIEDIFKELPSSKEISRGSNIFEGNGGLFDKKPDIPKKTVHKTYPTDVFKKINISDLQIGQRISIGFGGRFYFMELKTIDKDNNRVFSIINKRGNPTLSIPADGKIEQGKKLPKTNLTIDILQVYEAQVPLLYNAPPAAVRPDNSNAIGRMVPPPLKGKAVLNSAIIRRNSEGRILPKRPEQWPIPEYVPSDKETAMGMATPRPASMPPVPTRMVAPPPKRTGNRIIPSAVPTNMGAQRYSASITPPKRPIELSSIPQPPLPLQSSTPTNGAFPPATPKKKTSIIPPAVYKTPFRLISNLGKRTRRLIKKVTKSEERMAA